MLSNVQIAAIRKNLESYKGQNVCLKALGGRRKNLLAYGVLDGVYSDVFTVLVDMDGYTKHFSYTYNEILTKHVLIEPVG